MSVTERILTGIRNVLRQQDKIEALTEAVKQLSSEMRELDRRLVRIETMIELAQSQAVPRLPPKDRA